jgi:hypothetical protein
MSEKKPKTADLNVEIPLDLKQKLERYCEEHGQKIKFVVAKALEEFLQRHHA